MIWNKEKLENIIQAEEANVWAIYLINALKDELIFNITIDSFPVNWLTDTLAHSFKISNVHHKEMEICFWHDVQVKNSFVSSILYVENCCVNEADFTNWS